MSSIERAGSKIFLQPQRPNGLSRSFKKRHIRLASASKKSSVEQAVQESQAIHSPLWLGESVEGLKGESGELKASLIENKKPSFSVQSFLNDARQFDECCVKSLKKLPKVSFPSPSAMEMLEDKIRQKWQHDPLSKPWMEAQQERQAPLSWSLLAAKEAQTEAVFDLIQGDDPFGIEPDRDRTHASHLLHHFDGEAQKASAWLLAESAQAWAPALHEKLRWCHEKTGLWLLDRAGQVGGVGAEDVSAAQTLFLNYARDLNQTLQLSVMMLMKQTRKGIDFGKEKIFQTGGLIGEKMAARGWREAPPNGAKLSDRIQRGLQNFLGQSLEKLGSRAKQMARAREARQEQELPMPWMELLKSTQRLSDTSSKHFGHLRSLMLRTFQNLCQKLKDSRDDR